MPITFTHDPESVNLDTLWSMLRDTYWCPNIRRDVVARAVEHSLVIAAVDGDTLAGFARLITDRATFGWLCDVVVIPAYRRQGIAREMTRRLITHPDTNTIRRFALATRDAQGVYAPLGFELVPPGRWMEYPQAPSRWQSSEL